MKTKLEIFNEIEKLLAQYENEVNEAYNQGYLKENTKKTYLLHANNFVKWCNGNFEPGVKNKK
ncbi:hypothetical protein [Clostridium botulinum]|uniref:hypothetical protein n=1 Tax=Clostridium botulinum TaxID=1491 RepID=UPI001E37CD71|nr:hypothetical protein [Clostridium botulinum]MCD3202818.1 hypothetical protein [Clostridium botulinum C/D]MCD3230894.1 hypothetical protein [Clostridium botulinum C/D]MCD3253920.1 hypothetical protein [Clostridium botulinum C/D]MCD3279484.1 hypothetical protein [Clostridium botulinum C/D]MCD3281623.1 hypothetical protein [Clostridium botulinum C/D]